jgi:hypothetical protein
MLSANILYDTHDFSRLCGTDSTTLAVKAVPFGAPLQNVKNQRKKSLLNVICKHTL